MNEKIILAATAFLITIGMLHTFKPGVKTEKIIAQPPMYYQPAPPTIPTQPQSPQISNPIPTYLPYQGIVKQLDQWATEAPALCERGVLDGKTSTGQSIHFIRITNENKKGNPKVLVTGCIHGNEPHAAGTVMAYIGSLLAGYGKDQTITALIDSREIYFIPVLSPDSYPNSRYVDGVDPNRDYDNRRAAPIRAVQEFFQQHKFKAALSGHTWGRVFLIPHGNKMENCVDHEKFVSVLTEMSKLSGYRWMRACDMYRANGGLENPPIRYGENDWNVQQANVPIYGTEVDWYYANGAFAIVMEFGTHQRLPSHDEIKSEFNMTWKAFLHFLEKAPTAL